MKRGPAPITPVPKNTHQYQSYHDDQTLPKTETKRLRHEHFGPNIELFFKEDAIKIVRGSGQYLYDENGNQYLDCNSNVQHVGHSHPKVAEAVYKQMMTLNVNCRFLNDKLCNYTIFSVDTVLM